MATKTPTKLDSADVGRRLTILRYAMGYGNHGGKKRLCQEFGFNQSTYSEWESGGNMMQLDSVLLLIEDLPGVTLDWVYRGRADGVPLARLRDLEAAERAAEADRK